MDSRESQLQRDDAIKIGKIETMVEDMHDRLFGNGQPGEFDKLASRLNAMDKEIDDLKESRAKAHGAFYVISSIVSALGLTEIWHLFKK